jgi:hypothetical protein
MKHPLLKHKLFMPAHQPSSLKQMGFAMGLVLCAVCSAAPLDSRLQCKIFAGGEDHQFVFKPTLHPYTAKPIDLERFRFKAILSANAEHIENIKITVSYRTDKQPLILQQATYLPPFVSHQSLTGRQQLYSPNLGRELIYECTMLTAP